MQEERKEGRDQKKLMENGKDLLRQEQSDGKWRKAYY
jgi:hypothetical protein